jgi:hypothetical protein
MSPSSAWRRSGPHELQREHRAGVDRAARVLRQLARDGSGVDDGIAPVVDSDPFREELGAEAVALARDRIDS